MVAEVRVDFEGRIQRGPRFKLLRLDIEEVIVVGTQERDSFFRYEYSQILVEFLPSSVVSGGPDTPCQGKKLH